MTMNSNEVMHCFSVIFIKREAAIKGLCLFWDAWCGINI